MGIFLAIFISALAITGFSTPLIRRLAITIGFVDAPASRKLHKNPMPLMGGVAIFSGALIAFFILFFATGFYAVSDNVIGIGLAMTIVMLVGLADDRMGGMSAPVKLGGQTLAVVVLIYFGVYARIPFLPTILDFAITYLWIMVISNATNFLDNMDGACAGVSAVSAAFIVLLAAINGQDLVAGLGAAVLGACLGFLRYNFKPATIFMGDTGSLFLGFLLAVLALQLRFPENSNFVTWMVPLLLLGVQLFDLSLVTVSRLARGVNPLTTAGKDHTSHRLVELGYTQRESVMFLYLLGGAFGLVAIFVTQATILEGYVVGALLAFLALTVIAQFERLRRNKSKTNQ